MKTGDRHGRKTLTVIILTKNESGRIGDCLASAQGADEILVVDDESQDDTVDLARAAGARVVIRSLDSFAGQRNAAQAQAGGDWIFHLDADERLAQGLMEGLRRHMAFWPDAAGRVKRHSFAFGRRHRFGPLKPDWVTRLFPRGLVRWEKLVHERPIFGGPVRTLPGRLTHLTYTDWAQYDAKMARYAALWAADAAACGRRAGELTAWLRAGAAFLKTFGLNLGILGGPTTWALCRRHAGYTLAKYRNLAGHYTRQP